MKNLTNQIIFLLFPLVLQAQGSLNNLDRLNGFRIFKYGDKPEKHVSLLSQASAEDTKNKRIKEFSIYEGDFLNFGIDFKKISIYYIDDQLYKISLWTYYEEEDFKIIEALGGTQDFGKVNNEIIKLFGEGSGYTKKNDIGSVTYTQIWETQLNKLDYKITSLINNYLFLTVDFYNKHLSNIAELSNYE